MKLNALARIACVLAAFSTTWVGAAADSAAAVAHHHKSHGWQCVTYVRLITPILLRGNAWTWWKKATGQYDRGNEPKLGAVMVFKRTRVMPLGHVAVVRRIINDREVWIEHANWGRGPNGHGKVSVGDRVIDVSENNDWTDVRVWSEAANDFGRVNATYGFIYSPNYDPRTGIIWEQAENAAELAAQAAEATDTGDNG